jgi:hypothetical protein
MSGARATPLQVHAERALVGFGFLVLFFVLPHGLFNDDLSRYYDLQHLLQHGQLTNDKYSLIGPVLSAPMVLLGHVVRSGAWWATRFNVVVVAGGAVAVWRLLRDRVDAATLRRTLLALMFASVLTNPLRDYNAEVLTGTLVAVGIVCLVTDQWTAAGWVAIVLGAANTPALVPALVPFAVYQAVRTRRLRPLAALVLAAALVAGEAWLRRGSPFDTGYGGDHGIQTILPYSGKPGFSYPFLLGVASILFSSGRGLLFFTPGLALWLDSRTRAAAAEVRALLIPFLLVVVGLVLVYAKWWAWYGGLSWGPRFFLFAALPASLLLVLQIKRAGASVPADLIALVVLALSAWVGFAGAITDYSEITFCAFNNFALESMCWYVPDFSSLWWPVVHPPPFSHQFELIAAWCAAVFVVLGAPLFRSLAAAAVAALPGRQAVKGWRW